jgi:hypothetical protein
MVIVYSSCPLVRISNRDKMIESLEHGVYYLPSSRSLHLFRWVVLWLILLCVTTIVPISIQAQLFHQR